MQNDHTATELTEATRLVRTGRHRDTIRLAIGGQQGRSVSMAPNDALDLACALLGLALDVHRVKDTDSTKSEPEPVVAYSHATFAELPISRED